MPITKQKFKEGKLHSKVEEEIIYFLKERNQGAFTSQEIMDGIHYHTNFTTPEISKMSTFAIADFTTLLHHLVRQKNITMKVVGNRMYYMAMDTRIGKCPECGELFEPEKSWKTTGHPDINGKRIHAQVALYKCPKHGAFRKIMDKRNV